MNDEREAPVLVKAPVPIRELTVSGLNYRVKSAVSQVFPNLIWLVGEVSGFNKVRNSQFAGFRLLEHKPQSNKKFEVDAVIFGRERAKIERKLREARSPFQIEDEIRIRVLVRVDIHAEWGKYRVVIEDIDVDYFFGEAAQRKEQIRRKLVAEGILEKNRLLPFPALPLRVGLVTSLESDGRKDVVDELQRSGFAFSVVIHGVRVQGKHTEPSVLNALDWFRQNITEFDVILICRGGGSAADLVWFDSEPVARAVATFPLPVVVGIGHQADISALDYVGRCEKTPTAAAHLLVQQIRNAENELVSRLAMILAQGKQIVRDESEDVDEVASRLGPRALKVLKDESERVRSRERRLLLSDPRRVVERGYAILRSKDGKVIKTSARAPAGTIVVAELKRGRLRLRSEGPAGK